MWSKIKKKLYQHRYAILGGIGIVTLGFLGLNHLIRESDIKLSAFLQALKNNYIEQAVVVGATIYFRSHNEQIWHKTFLGRFPIHQIYALFNSKKIIFSTREGNFDREQLVAIVGTLMLGTTMYYMVNGIKVQTSSIQIDPKIYQNNYTFQDFYGGDIIKRKFRQIIRFMHDPTLYERFGARIRRGVLFYGPPGTGKTMLARALANQAKCEFIKVAASEFQEIFVGVGAKRVRELFRQARQCQKGCIIFIDQIDALGSRLNHLRDSHETTSTITQFLSEMDGFSQTDKIVVVAATNRPDLVDAAILRAGRFDLKVQINLPCKEQRLGIINKIISKRLKNNQITDQILNEISEKSQGWCGADLQALVNQSVYKAIKDKKQSVSSEHLFNSFEQMRKRLRYDINI